MAEVHDHKRVRVVAIFNCTSCGSEMQPWFDIEQRIYDASKDDAAFEKWLDTPCRRCGATPRGMGAR